MASKKTWILIVIGMIVLVGIVVALIFLLGDKEVTDDKAISVSKVSYTKVTGMKITQSDYVVDLVKTDGVWNHRNDIGADLDQSSMESALTMVCYLYAQEKLSDKVEDLSVYGLDPAAMLVEIELDDGTAMSFSFGSYTSNRDGVFMKYSGSDAVYIYDLDSFSILDNAAKAMCDLSIDIDADSLDKIEIMRASGVRIPITVEKIPDDKKVGLESWMLTSPFTTIANAEMVTLVKSFFAVPRYSAYVGDDILEEYGFGSSSAYIYLKESGGKSVKILIGGKTDSGRYYCTEEGKSGVYELASGFEALLEIEDSNIIPSALFPVSVEQTVNVTIEAGNATYELVNNGGSNYTLNDKALSNEMAQALYTYLSQLEFAGVTDNEDISGEPEAVVTLIKGGNELIYRFYRYRNDFLAVALNGSGTASGYIKADHLTALVSAFAEAYNSKG
jgi:hypothetical protein